MKTLETLEKNRLKNSPLGYFLFISVFFLLFSTFFQSEAQASIGKGPVQKLARGIVYLVASPFQLPKEVIQIAAQSEHFYLAPFKGVTAGAGSGLYNTGRQVIAGFWDIFTFWTPAGRDWGPLYESVSLFPEV